MVLWKKKASTENRDTTLLLLIPKFFKNYSTSDTQKSSSKKCFGKMRQEIFDRKTSCPPLAHKRFDPLSFLKHMWATLRICFGTVVEKFFDGKLDTPPPMQNFFLSKRTSETDKGSPTNNFGTVKQKHIHRNA